MSHCMYCGAVFCSQQLKKYICLQGVGTQLFCTYCKLILKKDKQLIPCESQSPRTYVSVHRKRGVRRIYKNWKECKGHMRCDDSPDIEFGYLMRSQKGIPEWYRDAFERRRRCGGMDDADLPIFWKHWKSVREHNVTYTLALIWGKDWPWSHESLPPPAQARYSCGLHVEPLYVHGDSLEDLEDALSHQRSFRELKNDVPFLLLIPGREPHAPHFPHDSQDLQAFVHPECVSDLILFSDRKEHQIHDKKWRATPPLLQTLLDRTSQRVATWRQEIHELERNIAHYITALPHARAADTAEPMD